MSRVDEEDVEAELEELIRADTARELDRLPDVPQRREGQIFFLILIHRNDLDNSR